MHIHAHRQNQNLELECHYTKHRTTTLTLDIGITPQVYPNTVVLLSDDELGVLSMGERVCLRTACRNVERCKLQLLFSTLYLLLPDNNVLSQARMKLKL